MFVHVIIVHALSDNDSLSIFIIIVIIVIPATSLGLFGVIFDNRHGRPAHERIDRIQPTTLALASRPENEDDDDDGEDDGDDGDDDEGREPTLGGGPVGFIGQRENDFGFLVSAGFGFLEFFPDLDESDVASRQFCSVIVARVVLGLRLGGGA